ncbi:uncharacterized protein LOC116294159 [Actinia tenebrosa]|uniref:Uncharacterized protein LOC116294159 n=1 Tax=Actinia tenebrosa TaxID=6105 RepID=A0A6P8HY78_ACTTE|nr:uncharacterized protein LOC116294159 [Actinia tenebrosa]XP_031557574.1 uncharacterized protein LOC116294159 [Actinia tenebrosa]
MEDTETVITIKEEQPSTDNEENNEEQATEKPKTPELESSKPIHINGGEILNKFNHALASIITTSDRLSNNDDSSNTIVTSLPPLIHKSARLVSSIWFPDNSVRSPIYHSSYDYPCIHERSVDAALGHAQIQEAGSSQQPVEEYDEFNEWVDGSCKFRYSLYSREAQAHISGWAMKYTNNHNKYVLKKTCVGVLLCSKDCTLPNGLKIVVRPAISDKVRERQIGQSCPNASCNGVLSHRKCTGNNGYPVTHFWVHQDDGIYFESKGTHDHFRPQARRATPDRNHNRGRTLSPKQEGTSLEETENAENKESKPAKSTETSKRGRKRKLHQDHQLSLSKILTTHSAINHTLRTEVLRGFSMEEEEQYVCVTLPESEHLIQRAVLSHDQSSIASYGRLYLLCQTFIDIVPGFNLLETRMISHEVVGWPVVMATLYRQGTREGIVQHMKTLARLCSSPREEIFSPKWQMVIHDFTPEQAQLAIEAIVNMIINSQVQTLLRVFQYKSVSSLYKMLREKVTSSIQGFHSHFELCKREIISRLQDPVMTMKFCETMKRLTDENCTVQEYLSADCMLSGCALGSVIREFWNFWGSPLVGCKVFPVASSIGAYQERIEIWRKSFLEVEWCDNPRDVTLQNLSDVVFRWIKCQKDFWPKTAYQDCRVMDFTAVRPPLFDDRRLHFVRHGERLGSAFHRPISYRAFYMPRMHWV